MMACTEAVILHNREPLYEAGARPKYAYFMTNGIASLVSNLGTGTVAEVGIIGREGVVGAVHLMGHLEVPMQCFVQVAGAARRLPFSTLERIFLSSVPVHTQVLEYLQMGYLNASQLAACNATHTVEQRLARWLLMVQDRMESDTYDLTHEFLADMLVAHRPTVSVAAATLQRHGLISYKHGKITILDRPRLQASACECYEISFKLLHHLYI